jgi:hypothetical protein
MLPAIIFINACLLGSCPVPPVVTIPNVEDFLVQKKCPNGSAPFTVNCPASNQTYQTVTDQVHFTKRDWPAPNGYQSSDDALEPNGSIVMTFQFGPPFGSFSSNPTNGGDLLQIINGAAIATETRDGGTPHNQYFVGPNCGGTGWIFFTNTVPVNEWQSVVARLSDVPDPKECPPLGEAYTRAIMGNVTVPFYHNRKLTYQNLQTVISEHYNNGSLARATALERFYFAPPWGKWRWEAWSKTQKSTVDLSSRCPQFDASQLTNFPFQPNNDPSWNLVDCRTWTNIVPLKTPYSVSQFGWP